MDVIQREIIIQANINRVFEAVTNPSHFGVWFSDGVEGDFLPGSQPVIDEGRYGKFRLAIIANEVPHYFAYRWVSGSQWIPAGFTADPLTHPNTLVEFFFEEKGDSTLVRVKESGFESLPDEYRKSNYEDNCGGWDYQLARLVKFVQTGSPE